MTTNITLNQRIQASVAAHYLENNRAATLKEVADRLVGVSLTSVQLRKYILNECASEVPGCVWARISLNSNGTHRIVDALEPDQRLLGKVLAHLSTQRHLTASVVVRPVLVVG